MMKRTHETRLVDLFVSETLLFKFFEVRESEVCTGRAVHFCAKKLAGPKVCPGRADFLQTYIIKLVIYMLWFSKFVSS